MLEEYRIQEEDRVKSGRMLADGEEVEGMRRQVGTGLKMAQRR